MSDQAGTDPPKIQRGKFGEPPLAGWLTAETLQHLSQRWPYSLLLTSYLAVAGSVGMAFLLGRMLFDARFGLLIVLLLACHGPVLQMTLAPAANALSVFFALVALYGYVCHMQHATHPLSIYLLIGAFGLGLCLLAGGPIALTMLAAMLLTLAGPCQASPGFNFRQAFKTGKRRTGCPFLLDIVLLGLIATALAGWWPLIMGLRNGAEFWSDWLTGKYITNFQAATQFSSGSYLAAIGQMTADLIQKLGCLIGLAALGLWRAIQELVSVFKARQRAHPTQTGNAPNSEQQPGPVGDVSVLGRRQLTLQLLVLWTLSSAAAWMVFRISNRDQSPVAEMYSVFLMLPLVFLAAFAIVETLERRACVFEIVGASLLSVYATTWINIVRPALELAAKSTVGLWLAGLIAIAALAWWCQSITRHREFAKQRVLKTCIVLLVLANILLGLGATKTADDTTADLQVLRRRLSRIHDVTECTIMSQIEPPARLVFTVKSLWPTATLRHVQRWEDLVSTEVAFSSRDTSLTNQPPGALQAMPTPHTQQILVVWGPDSNSLAAAVGERLPLTPVASQFLLDKRLLSVHRLIDSAD